MNVELIKAISHRYQLRALAIIKGVRYGVGPGGDVGLSFGAYIAEGVGAPQFLPDTLATGVINLYQVGDVSRLEGKPCWVTITDGVLAFDSPCLI
jgi:hypothetical protein